MTQRPSEQAREEATALEPKRFAALRRMLTDNRHRVVLSLGGGALPGLAGNLALTRILEELDLIGSIDEIWGTSAGAVIGGGIASGAPSDEILDLVAGLRAPGILDRAVLRFAWRLTRSATPFVRRPMPEGILPGENFLEAIRQGLRCETFDDCKIPFRCIACTDDGRATPKIFRRGQLVPAIFSSMALPGIMIPRPGDETGATYYDGGLVEKSPLRSPIADHGRSGDDRRLVVLCTHFFDPTRKGRKHTFLSRFLETLYALEEVAWEYQLAEARARDNVIVILLDPRLEEPSMFAFENTVPNYLRARDAFLDALQDGRLVATFGAG